MQWQKKRPITHHAAPNIQWQKRAIKDSTTMITVPVTQSSNQGREHSGVLRLTPFPFAQPGKERFTGFTVDLSTQRPRHRQNADQ